MGPRQSVSYNSATSTLSSTEIPRRPKKRGKYQLAVEKYSTKKKPRSGAATFQKKLYVFKYMGLNAPDNFTRSDKDIVMRGLLPQILVSAKESDLRNEICEVVNSCTELSDIGPTDFEFINMAGKQASIPRCKPGFEWNGRAVKELAGSGAVYICLKRFPGSTSSNSSSDDELVSYLASSPVTPATVHPREPVTPATMHPREPVTSTVMPAAREPLTPVTVPPRTPVMLLPENH